MLLGELARTFIISAVTAGLKEALRRTLMRVADEGVRALLTMLFSRFWSEEGSKADDRRASALIRQLLAYMQKQGFEEDWACTSAPGGSEPTAGEVHADPSHTSPDARARMVALALIKP